MSAILKQLAGKESTQNYLRERVSGGELRFSSRGSRLTDLMRLLRITIPSLPPVSISINALDGCLPKYLPKFLRYLRDIVRESPTTRIFLTGRPHTREDVRSYFTKAIVIPISPKADDIRNYLETRLGRDDESEATGNDLRADIVRVIRKK